MVSIEIMNSPTQNGDSARVFGVDIGGVIINRHNHERNPDFFTEPDFLETPAVEGAFDGLAWLVDKYDGRVCLISTCFGQALENTLKWFDHHRFFKKTGIDEDNVFFCNTRPQKAELCESKGVTDCIDDSQQVLRIVSGVVSMERLYYFNPAEGLKRAGVENIFLPESVRPMLRHLPCWTRAEEIIMAL